jgi:hypothetical protein
VKYVYQEPPHPENTAFPRSQNVERNREHGFIRISISKKTPQTINENREPLGLPPWKNNLPLRGLNQVLGCTNLTLAPTSSHMNKQVQVFLVK